jgi:hypothetical protein
MNQQQLIDALTEKANRTHERSISKAEGIDLSTVPDYVFGYQEAYRDLWESINGPGSWDVNPWVWVIEFRRVI